MTKFTTAAGKHASAATNPNEPTGRLATWLAKPTITLLGMTAAAALALSVVAGSAEAAPAQSVKNIVLVHGAFADGNVAPLLEKHGCNVIAVQNAMTTYADDVATTKRVIDAQKGPVVLLGHSYGGAVITIPEEEIHD